MKKAIFITLVLSLCMTTNVFANQLTNSDFEDGDTGQLGVVTIPGWSSWGGSGWHHDDPGRMKGTKGMKTWWDDAGIYQDFAVTPGVTYTFSVECFDSTLEPLTEWNGLIKAEFYDSSVGTSAEDALLNLELDRFYSATDPIDTWVTIGGTATAPANADIGRIVMMIVDWAPDPSGALNFDNASVVIGGGPTATDPEPADGASSLDAATVTRLKWQKPEPRSSADDWHDILCDAYLSDGSADVNSLNFQYHIDQTTGKVTQKLTSADANSVSVTAAADGQYLWRVDCHDPNNGNGGGGAAVILTPGIIWSFDTINDDPTVDAGLRQAQWLPASAPIEVTFGLDADASDDGLPSPPSKVTYLWTDSGPGTVTYFPSNTVQDPNVTMTVNGDYTLTLTVSDSQKSSDDSVELSVYANNYTGLLAKWELNNDPCDTGGHSGGPYDGTIVGSPSFDVDAQVGAGSVLVDGDDYVEIPNSGSDPNWQPRTWAEPDTEEITLSAWVKVDSFSVDWQTIIGKGNATYRMQRAQDTDTAMFAMGFGGVQRVVWGQQNVNDGKWHHIAGTIDGAYTRIYIDGVMDAEVVSNEFPIPREPENIKIGQDFEGRVDQVRLYEVGVPGVSDHTGTPSVLKDFIDDGGHNACGQNYVPADVNEDCYVDLKDVADLAQAWLTCTDVTNSNCN